MSEKTLEGMIENALSRQMDRGDLESQAFGSGARADGGKPAWGLMPLDQVMVVQAEPIVRESPRQDEDTITTQDLIWELAKFQRTGTRLHAYNLLAYTYAFLMDSMYADFYTASVEVIRVWEHGEKKYAAFNWMKGMSWNSVIGCYMRHVQKIQQGTTVDEESGRLHAAHLVCNAMMLVHYTENYPEGNDLPTRWYRETNDDSQSRA